MTILRNLLVTRMRKNLYAPSVAAEATTVASTAAGTMPFHNDSYSLLTAPMKMPSTAAYTSTAAGLITRRAATTMTVTKPAIALMIMPAIKNRAGMNMKVSAATPMTVPSVIADLVITSSMVITPPG